MTMEEREEAVEFLLSQATEGVLHAAFNQSPQGDWWMKHHFGMGLWVRNKLRQRFDWDDLTLDREWAGLVAEAAQRYMDADLLEGD